MNKEKIIEQMQRYLDGDIISLPFDITAEMDDLQAFYCRTAKRLVIAYELQKDNSDYQDDFLMALRDFLLVFETSMTIRNAEIICSKREYQQGAFHLRPHRGGRG